MTQYNEPGDAYQCFYAHVGGDANNSTVWRRKEKAHDHRLGSCLHEPY